jgi:hypothetical protein
MIIWSVAHGANAQQKVSSSSKKRKKYQCKKENEKPFLQFEKIMSRFSTKERLHECYHWMSSQKNKAMNKSIMR